MVKQVQDNSDAIRENRTNISAIREDIQLLREAANRPRPICGEPPGRQSDLAIAPPPFRAGARTADQEAARIKKYNASRCALRIWPIPGDNPTAISDSLRKFIEDSLGVDQQGVDCLGIRWVERTKTHPKAKINEEVRVTFNNQYMRDEMASKGRLLADLVNPDGTPSAGFRIDVPDYLASDFTILQEYGFRMRRVHGKGTKRHYKFDDESCSIYMDLKIEGSDSYIKITPELARSLRAESEREEISRLRKQLTARAPADQDRTNSNFTPLEKAKTSSRDRDGNGITSSLIRMSEEPRRSGPWSGATGGVGPRGPIEPARGSSWEPPPN